MADLPNGPLPDVSVLKPRVLAILEEVGVASLNMNDLRKRLQGEYKINLKPHVAALNAIVQDVMKEPAMKVALAKAAKAAQTPAGQVTKREKGVKKEKAQKKEKEAKKEKAPKAGKKEKVVKDENEPKRALSAYFIFGNEKRPAIMEAVRAKGEKVNIAEIGKQITAMWAAETNKQKYEALAAKDKERYAAEKAKFDSEGGAKVKATKKTATKRGASKSSSSSSSSSSSDSSSSGSDSSSSSSSDSD
jgi:hypothetical protein